MLSVSHLLISVFDRTDYRAIRRYWISDSQKPQAAYAVGFLNTAGNYLHRLQCI